MDDATSMIYSAFLVEEEGTVSTIRALLEVFTAQAAGHEMGIFCQIGISSLLDDGRSIAYGSGMTRTRRKVVVLWRRSSAIMFADPVVFFDKYAD
jgi:hypothetical protein